MSHDPIETTAWADLIGASASVGPATLLICPEVDSLLFNRAIVPSDAEPDVVRRVLRRFEAEGVDRFLIQGGRDRSMLRAGLTRYHRAWIALTRDPRGPIRERPTDLRVERSSPRQASAVAEVLARGFELPSGAVPRIAALLDRPRWHVFSAMDGPFLVGAGAMFVDGRCAYLAMAATAPSHRGRGAQSALLARRLAVARQLGCVRVVAETGEAVAGEPNPSFNNMVRAGFYPCATRANHAPPGTRWKRDSPGSHPGTTAQRRVS